MAKLVCTSCGKIHSTNYKGFKCSCGGLLDLQFSAKFPINEIKNRKPTMWRYREAIPIENNEDVVSFDEGFTPLLPLLVNGKEVLVKQDHLFQTGSYKDRGASVLISHAKEMGIKEIVEDSSGNAGAAIAAYATKAGMKCDVYLPYKTSSAKISQIKAYFAIVHEISGPRENATRAVMKAAENTFYASHVYNPFFLHGTKTFAYEVVEQLSWKPPDTVILPVGNGTLLLGAYIGFVDLFKARIIEKIPKFIAVQAFNCDPLAVAFSKGFYAAKIYTKKTIAEGIAIAKPARAKQIIDVVKKTKGHFITVKESEIVQSLKWMAKKGYHVEPTTAATFAGLKKYVNEGIGEDELIVSTITGHGLKDVETPD